MHKDRSSTGNADAQLGRELEISFVKRCVAETNQTTLLLRRSLRLLRQG